MSEVPKYRASGGVVCTEQTEIKTYADGKLVPYENIRKWEAKRVTHVTSLVHRLLNLEQKSSDQHLDEQRNSLAEMKIEAGKDKLRKKLGFYLGLSQLVMQIASFLSFGRRKYSVVEIAVSGVVVEPSEFLDKLNHIMLNDDLEYDKMRLMACPDHYLIANTGENTQEVIETTGGSPFPTQFFIRYGDAEGLCSEKDPTYDEQMFGVARTKNGAVIGGVRHQIRKESDGLRLKLLVEFPALVPGWMIRQHQTHLMCEFNNWVRDVLKMPTKSSE
ncbi:hypothetical protein K493DRAFT_321539 [Basidiobolus meristosporus CBS 931.73]|uniref:Uncharacterized protein n=1 Tax=Basidiobolus meristosporus CBS 931.73 TaxID=1314790 RepID=A0A1Y1WSQ7_9FUNG|nr:hypothetical protein K493DRAFT_321539 [Basidiobolus meristosporus CBS 931.73]|eukprot:ORX76563.1 hypothetical protein K493DRAFT_321539 [Basidiobolus meristosporus CBS 931.73]